MQHTTGVAIVATHLATTDRRALSQAWYSALHLAERNPSAPAGRPHGAAPRTRTARRSDERERGRHDRGGPSCARPGDAAARSAQSARAAVAALPPERRSPKTELARRIERALSDRVPRGTPASFAVSIAEGRVHLLVRSDGVRTHVLAVCAVTVRERVERALVHARFALAGSGLRAEFVR